MERCAQCPGQNECLPAEGPRGECLFIGEAPGKDENRRKTIFIGKTGKELNDHYLPLAGLRRSQVRIINSIACLPTTPKGKLDLKQPKHKALLSSCSEQHLLPEMAENPRLKVLVPMGAFACHAVDPDINLEMQHGTPVPTRWGLTAFPMYHPARGIHEPKKMLELRTDWIRLKEYLRGKYVAPVDEYPEPDYAEVTDPDEIECIDYTLPLGCDTESSPSEGPYFLTYSQYPGTGRLVRAGRTDLLSAFQRALDRQEAEILFHNWLYDWRPIAGLGLRFRAGLLRDTMVRAFHLGNLPQGLKALAFRELGMLMQDFEDLVLPHSRERVLAYYRLAQEHKWPKPDPELERDKDGLWKMKNPQGMNTKLKRFFTDYSKNPEKDVFQMWTKNWVSQQASIEAVCGPWPGMDIAHVPFELALHYACRDADALVRLWPVLKRMRERVRDYPQEQWRAA